MQKGKNKQIFDGGSNNVMGIQINNFMNLKDKNKSSKKPNENKVRGKSERRPKESKSKGNKSKKNKKIDFKILL